MRGERTVRVRVYGIVQGVGFRPTVSRHAMSAGVRGSVCNKGPYVEIFAQGGEEALRRFLRLLEQEPPRRAAILKMDREEAPNPPEFPDFAIIESEKKRGEIYISPDIAVCDACKAELYDPKDRRYLHPFINCTCCGPRLTILDALPYDRERTSMKEFPLCTDCAAEYHDPATRRYDAQPVCCNDCGPEVYLLDRPERGRAAITEARRTILRGGIVAVKGIGGFHLCCDAGSEEAVRLLRARKHRPRKPFAVMLRDLDAVKRNCYTSEEQDEILTGHQKPILLLDKKSESTLAPSIAPGNPKVGVMLPYAPVQLLLFDYDDGLSMPEALVMTSGNPSGAPICRDDSGARQALGPLSDAILSHNRKIRIRADDTVMDFFRGEPYMVRRSRGYAPLPVLLSNGWKGKTLAIGGELKNTFCLAVNDLFYLSPYVGDLADLRTVEALEETVRRFETLLETQPETVVCDLHPRYNSTLVARSFGLPVLEVQHHYAHILSCMAENDCLEPVLGVSFDGTGYGEDGTIWGGELLLCDCAGYERGGSIAPFLQLGGDASAREGWRIAVSLLRDLTGSRAKTVELAERLGLCDAQTAGVQMTMYERRINAVRSTSAGRLFDAVSALLGVCRASTFEGDAAVTLQFAARRWTKPESFSPTLREEEGRLILGTDRLLSELLDGVLTGEPPERLAYRFHLGLAELTAAACVELRRRTGRHTVALSGGCFQNTLLLGLTLDRLEARGFRVLRHRMVPPNDGGIALGQALYGQHHAQTAAEEAETRPREHT